MTQTTEELDTTKEEVSLNGHDETWLTFNDDKAFLDHITAQKPAEELVPIPEWQVKILCRELDVKSRLKIQMMAYDSETKLTDYRKPDVFALVVLAGCYNPTTGKHSFPESYRSTLANDPKYGKAVGLLAITVLRISGMITSESDRIKKN